MHNSIKDLVAAYPACCDNHKKAIENKMRFEINSAEKFTRIKVDGCLIPSQLIEKCDYGFYRHSNGDFYFVELKGTEIQKGFNQIVNTINHIDGNHLKIQKNQRFGFIVSSEVPKAGIKLIT